MANGLFMTPDQVRRAQQQQAADMINQGINPVEAGMFNLGQNMYRGIDKYFGGDPRTAQERQASAMQERMRGIDFSDPSSLYKKAMELNNTGNIQEAIAVLQLIPKVNEAPETWSEPYEKTISEVDPATGHVVQKKLLLKKSSRGNTERVGEVTSKSAPGTGASKAAEKAFKLMGNAFLEGREEAVYSHPSRHSGAPFVIEGYDPKTGKPLTKPIHSKEIYTTEKSFVPPKLSEKYDAATILKEMESKFGSWTGWDWMSQMSADERQAAAVDITRMIATRKGTDNEYKKRYADNPTAAKNEIVNEWIRLNRPDLSDDPVVDTQEEYDSLPSGAMYIDKADGQLYRKP